MKRCFRTLWLVVAIGLATGCKPSAGTAPTAASVEPPLPTEAQGKLATIKLYMGAQEMNAEMALTPLQQETGMMFRTNMGENDGMIFPMPYPMHASFWMKNCPLPLSAAYIDKEGTIVEIHKLEAQDTNSVVASADNIQFVLETPAGWFQKHGVSTGTVITTEKGSLAKTFLER
jgi:uncharacterized protein